MSLRSPEKDSYSRHINFIHTISKSLRFLPIINQQNSIWKILFPLLNPWKVNFYIFLMHPLLIYSWCFPYNQISTSFMSFIPTNLKIIPNITQHHKGLSLYHLRRPNYFSQGYDTKLEFRRRWRSKNYKRWSNILFHMHKWFYKKDRP